MSSDIIYSQMYDDDYYEEKARKQAFQYADTILAWSNGSKYAWWYFWLVEKCICRGVDKKTVSAGLNGEYLEVHHIIPRSFDPNLENVRENKVPMTAREHFVAHLLLTKMFCKATQSKFYYKALKATQMFWRTNSQQKRHMSSSQYEKLRKLASEAKKLQAKPARGRTFGKKCYTNGVRNIFLGADDVIPEGFVIGNTWKDMIRITDGTVNRTTYPSDVIPEGFWVGSCTKGKPRPNLKGRPRLKYDTDSQRSANMSKAAKNKICITDGINDTKINKWEPIPDGWTRGRTHGKPPKYKVCCVLCGAEIVIANFGRHYDGQSCNKPRSTNEN